MKLTLKQQWRAVPVWIRKPLIFLTGLLFIIAAALTGWLPGPGGIPLFLIGIAILSTEFEWAKRVKRIVMELVYGVSRWYRQNTLAGNILLALVTIGAFAFLYMAVETLFR